jgi:hypothetical protein
MHPGYAKPRSELPWLPYRETDKVFVINSHNFGGGWTPADIATVGWWDAADTGTYFDATSGGSVISTHNALVRRWEDKSGNASHATQSSAVAPRIQLTSNLLNGLPCVRFSAATDSQFNVAASSNFIPDLLSACVVMRTSSTDTNRGVLGRWGALGNFWGLLHRTNLSPFAPIAIVQNSANNALFSALATSQVNDGGGRLLGSTMETGGSVQAIIDGTVEASTSQVSNRTGTSAMTIGSYTTGASATGLTGDIAEIVMWRSAVTDTRQRVEGYLAHKWGLTANLPSDHPYKSVAP